MFLAIGALGFISGATSDSGFWFVLYLILLISGGLILYAGIKDMNSNPEENAAKAKNYQRQLIAEKQKVEAELNKMKNVKDTSATTSGDYATDEGLWE